MRSAVLLLLAAGLVSAHIGSPDVYLDAKAGPYPLFVTIRPPSVIPGVAQIEVRAASGGITRILAAPLRMTGAGARLAPVPDQLQAAKDDPRTFTGALWLMESGSSQIRITVDGSEGPGVVSVPLPALAQSTRKMQPSLGGVLLALMIFLLIGLIAIAGAAVREAQLSPGASPGAKLRRNGRVVMAVVAVLLIGLIWYCNSWWNAEAAEYSEYIYKPLDMKASIEGATSLRLQLSDPGWLEWRKIDDFVPDHNHLMHLYMIRQPGLDVIYHLHPDMTGAGVFQLDMPSVPAGRYKLYADVVHEDGFPETLVSVIDLPAIAGRPLAGDDATGAAKPLGQAVVATEFPLPDGYRMVFERPDAGFHAKRAQLFHFTLLDPHGAQPDDMALYMGMLGHAAFVKSDGTVFAHIHPNGTVAMAAFMMAQKPYAPAETPHASMNMAGMDMPKTSQMPESSGSLPNAVSFPYGFPSAGSYRIFVQMKHGGTIETGVFDAAVQ